jgi:hypothetical protein
MEVRATQSDMLEFLLLIVYCALVVWLHELDRTIPIDAALMLAIPCTAVICAPFLYLERWLLRRRERRLLFSLFEQRLHERSAGHVLPGSSRAPQLLIAQEPLRRLPHREIA